MHLAVASRGANPSFVEKAGKLLHYQGLTSQVPIPTGASDLFLRISRRAQGSVHTPVQWFPRIKRPRREADHSALSYA